MLKKILTAAAVLLLPAMIIAAEAGGIGKDDRAYIDIKALVDSGVSTMQLTKDTITRSEALEYIDNAVSNTAQTGFSASKDDLEKLYGLVKMFQTDMMEKGRKLGDIEDTLASIKVQETALDISRIEDKENTLLDTMGFKINGEAGFYMTDLLLIGDKYGTSERYRPLTQYIDLKASVKPSRGLYAEAVFRVETLCGGNWGSDNIYGVKKFFVQGDYSYPLSFTLGFYNAKLTPFTLWAVDDDRPFESEVFSNKRDMIKKELSIEDNSWPLTGGKASTKVKIFGDFAVSADIMAARLNEATGTYSTPYASYSTVNYLTYTADNFIYPHDRYMAAGRLSSDFTLKDMLLAGCNFVEIKDAEDTGVKHGSPVLDNYVTSADAQIKLFGIAKLTAEFAVSDYYVGTTQSPAVWNNKYISDTAFKTGIEAEYFNTKVEGSFSVVGNSFNAYSSQSRIYDGYNNYGYLTMNNTWNVSALPNYYLLYGKSYPFTKYGQSIVSSYLPTGNNLMPYSFYENNASPYGDSTPNRQGFTAKISGKYLDDMISPYARYSYLTEIVSYLPGNQRTCPREFNVIEGGTKLKLWDINFKGGYKYEITDNEYTGGSVHLKSSTIDAGASYTFAKKLTLALGFKDNAFDGTEYPYTYTGTSWGYTAKTQYDMNIMSYGADLNYEVVKNAAVGVAFTNTVIKDNLDNKQSSIAQEIDAKITFKF
jgi:hypothetical protein